MEVQPTSLSWALNGKNYGEWSLRVMSKLDRKGWIPLAKKGFAKLKEHKDYQVDDNDSAAVKKRKEEALEKLRIEDKDAKDLIISTVLGNQLDAFKGDAGDTTFSDLTTFDLWEALRMRYALTTPTNRINLGMQLYGLKYRPQQESLDDFCLM